MESIHYLMYPCEPFRRTPCRAEPYYDWTALRESLPDDVLISMLDPTRVLEDEPIALDNSRLKLVWHGYF
ncbi:hypothetical protein KDA_49050 [Dictyobacter alpinus]|uniref:Uncharacterized protein n=1 Tax=Dictyobacter alpinus TaxID=2014873 RepID=A0A402BDE1_9CHLR|nr:hypothetical protein KDA_49050 [Dictyobacter alpinus]